MQILGVFVATLLTGVLQPPPRPTNCIFLSSLCSASSIFGYCHPNSIPVLAPGSYQKMLVEGCVVFPTGNNKKIVCSDQKVTATAS